MPEGPVNEVCPAHHLPFAPSGPGLVACGAGCVMPLPFPASPLTSLGQGATGHNELVLTYQAAGFSRVEAIQILCCVIQAGIMRGSGG
jgi:hypothetical protein